MNFSNRYLLQYPVRLFTGNLLTVLQTRTLTCPANNDNFLYLLRRDGRVADGGGLENRCPVLNGTVGSNPTPSAIFFLYTMWRDGRVGRRRSPAKRVYTQKAYRGFESLSLRHYFRITADCIFSSRCYLLQQQHILYYGTAGTHVSYFTQQADTYDICLLSSGQIEKVASRLWAYNNGTPCFFPLSMIRAHDGRCIDGDRQ